MKAPILGSIREQRTALYLDGDDVLEVGVGCAEGSLAPSRRFRLSMGAAWVALIFSLIVVCCC